VSGARDLEAISCYKEIFDVVSSPKKIIIITENTFYPSKNICFDLGVEVVSRRRDCGKVFPMRWDCGKTPKQCLPYRIPSYFPIAMTLFTNCDGTATLHRSGPPPRTRNFLKEHLVQECFSKTCTRCSCEKVSCFWREA